MSVIVVPMRVPTCPECHQPLESDAPLPPWWAWLLMLGAIGVLIGGGFFMMDVLWDWISEGMTLAGAIAKNAVEAIEPFRRLW